MGFDTFFFYNRGNLIRLMECEFMRNEIKDMTKDGLHCHTIKAWIPCGNLR